ncbi:MAG: hypothetical protein QGG73_00070 [Candidatus Hydrogenedentes bacterium]|jgi:hypothetical protein|nr:hypothetical protein [Candidatus Hydrogenedentota bacterium]
MKTQTTRRRSRFISEPIVPPALNAPFAGEAAKAAPTAPPRWEMRRPVSRCRNKILLDFPRVCRR